MAFRAGGHIEIFGADSRGLLVHSAMAGFTSHTFGDMNLVIEVNIIGQAVDPVPLYRCSVGITVSDRLQAGDGFCDLTVASHTGFSRREICKRGLVDPGVTVSAVQAQYRDMKAVGKRNWLRDRDTDFGKDSGVGVPDQTSGYQSKKYKARKNADFRNEIASSRKKLWHTFPRLQ